MTENENAEPCVACTLMAVASGMPYSRMHTMMHVDRDMPVVGVRYDGEPEIGAD